MNSKARPNRKKRRNQHQDAGRVGGSGERRFLMTLPAGLTDLAVQCLCSDVVDVSVEYRDDSAVLISTRSGAERVAQLGYVKNAFEVVLAVPRSSFAAAAKQIAGVLQGPSAPRLPRFAGFRLMAQVDGQLAPLERSTKVAIERSLQRLTGGSVVSRGGGDEMWLIGRSELDSIVLGRRITHTSRTVPKGALGAELSELLVRLSRPHRDDVFLDPFGGSGALACARTLFPAERIISSDLYAEPTLLGGEQVEVLAEDARELTAIADGAVDIIVTDPPWGEHEELPGGAESFYAAMSASFARVLHPVRGGLVILISRHGEQVLAGALGRQGFAQRDRIPIVLNGHPAVVLVAVPNPG